jgi:drug/metabolite transporter (DMT)-like permease
MQKRAHLQKYLYLYLILAMISWGVSWPTSKILTLYSDTYTLMFLKFFLSSATIAPIIFWLLKPKQLFNKTIIRPLIFATLFIILYNIIFFYGLKIGYAGLAGVIVTGSNPIFTFALIAFLNKSALPNRQKSALTLGLIGTLITVDILAIDTDDLLQGGNLLFLAASLCWTLVTLYSTQAHKEISGIVFTLYLYLFSSLISLLFFVPPGSLTVLFTYDAIFWINLIFTTVINTGIATTFYFYASNTIGAHYTSSFIFLVPLSAVISSNLLLSEVPAATTLIGGTLLILSIYLINKPARV